MDFAKVPVIRTRTNVCTIITARAYINIYIFFLMSTVIPQHNARMSSALNRRNVVVVYAVSTVRDFFGKRVKFDLNFGLFAASVDVCF